MKGLRVHLIVVACIVTLGVALLGQHFFYQQKVADPLLAQIGRLSGVSHVSFETSSGSRRIALDLAPGADLHSVFTTAHDLGKKSLGTDFGGVTIHDNRNQALEDSYYRMHFYVQQAIATGMFTDMANGIDHIADQDNLSAHRVFVDEENVYVQLTRNGHSLYEVVVRPQVMAQAQPEKGGTATW